MHEAKSIAVHVVSWNSMAHLPALFESLDAQTLQDFSATVVDNASTDGVISWLQQERPGVAALRNFRNQGYARAHNQAIQLTMTRWHTEELSSRYILILKPNVELAPTAIAELRAFLDAHPDVAACTPTVLRAKVIAAEDGTRETERLTTIEAMGVRLSKSRALVDLHAGEANDAQASLQFTDVFACSGACVMFRASAVQSLIVRGEFFDEDFVSTYETVDVCWRMARAGMRLCVLPQTIAWHHVRLDTSETQVRKVRNRLWLIWKNDDPVNLLVHMPWILPSAVFGTVTGIFRPSRWRAWTQALMGLPRMIAKRREFAPRALVSRAVSRTWFAS